MTAFLLSAGLRIAEVERWNRPELVVNGERLLATNDSYFWVAGAERINTVAERMPMSRLLELESHILRMPLADLAFWNAAILAALAVVPISLWCFELGAPYAAFLAPMLAGLAPAYYNRTRLGFYDTDWAAWFFPLLISWLLARWIQPRLKLDTDASLGDRAGYSLPALIILVTAFGLPWHPFIGLFTLALLGLAGILVIIRGWPDARASMLLTLAAIALPVAGGWIGAGAGLMLAWWSGRQPVVLHKPWALGTSAGLLVLLLAAITGLQFQEYLVEAAESYLGRFIGGWAQDPAILELHFPSVAASVREIQDVGLLDVLQGAGFHPLLGVLGVAGFFVLCWTRLRTIFLLPLLGLGLAAMRMGIRFTMFAAPPLVLGLLVPVEWVLRRESPRRGWRPRTLAASTAVAALLFIPAAYRPYTRLPADPVLTKAHAAALIELGRVAPPDAVVWTWWDYGYAAQHFAGLETFADGRRNSGEFLFTLGTVLGSDALERSAAMMRFTAAHEYVPWQWWMTWSEREFEAWLGGLGQERSLEVSFPAQYLVVSWEGLPALPWIQYDASWNFATGEGARSRVVRVPHPESLDFQTGILIYGGGEQLGAVSIDILPAPTMAHFDYQANSGGPHLLLNEGTGEVMLLDERAYRSTFTQLLIQPVDDSGGLNSFELILDEASGVRIFMLR
jgi:hypothetical protein